MAAAAVLALLATAAVSGCAAFGARPSGERQARIERSPEWRDGEFRNAEPMWTDMTAALDMLLHAAPDETPSAPVPTIATDAALLKTAPPGGLRVTWFGHSSTLVEIDGLRLLTDPVWSERPTPVPGIGPKRFFPPTIALADVPPVDAVLVSHDHYDHLDRPTIAALIDGPAVFIVPLGIGAHLERWGVPPARIVELDWWQATRLGALTITATPARHSSGRINPRGDRTLWSGFALTGPAHRVFYSGDTGRAASMADVGTRLGPFDLALVEAGQYDAGWPDWHLGPEQAVDVARAVKARVLMPVHWGLFKLANHGWTEPVERVLVAAACDKLPVLTPRPGESVEPSPEAAARSTRWWPAAAWRGAAETPIVATQHGDPAQRVAPAGCAVAAR